MAFLDETGLAELWALVKAEDAKGAKVATGSYTGTGKHGADYPNKLTFSFVPKFVFLHTVSGELVYNVNSSTAMSSERFFWSTGQTVYKLSSANNLRFTQSGNTLSWYASGTGAGSITQCNSDASTYYYVAIG